MAGRSYVGIDITAKANHPPTETTPGLVEQFAALPDSVQSRLLRVLDVVRDTTPKDRFEAQMFLTQVAALPNLKKPMPDAFRALSSLLTIAGEVDDA